MRRHEVTVVSVGVRDRGGVLGDGRQELTWQRDTPTACADAVPVVDVVVLAAELEDALARSTALALNYAGDFDAAQAIIDKVVARLQGFPSGVPFVAVTGGAWARRVGSGSATSSGPVVSGVADPSMAR